MAEPASYVRFEIAPAVTGKPYVGRLSGSADIRAGRAKVLLDGALPATDLGLYISGRAGFEIVQKAWAAGCSAVVAVSAPSALAVEAARLAGITMAGFVRAGGSAPSCNLYSPAVT